MLLCYARKHGLLNPRVYVDACVIIGLTGKTLAATGIAPI